MKWLAALLALIGCGLVREPTPPVRVAGGWLRGALAPQGTHYQYFGVPYAAVDDTNRFQAPLPAPRWDGILEATDASIRCPQQMVGPLIMGDPDCLKLNVYSPVRRSANKLLPVMVYIHGGCFLEGTGSGFLYGGDYFMDHGVVFVGVNYRLNVEGFLCLGIKEAPGNAGLKDQIAALRWIQENIAAFGGDPDNVTLFGESAGAVSTSYLVLSPAARGLFHRAILQSGSSLAPWATQHDPIETARTLAKAFGHNTRNPHEIYKVLAKKTVEELISAIKYSEHRNYITADTLFVPCIENDIPGVEPVLTQYPADIIQSGNYTKVPMIIGYNDNEGIYFVAKDYGTSASEVDPIQVLQSDLQFPSEEAKNFTAHLIREHYFSKKTLISGLVDLYSDLHFKYPSVVESDLYAQTSDQPIYYYLFKYSGLINMPKVISWFGTTSGASHADELFYLFKPHSFPLPHNFLESDMIRRMVTLWTNFAKYSDPTPAHSRLVPLRWRAGSRRSPAALVLDQPVSVAAASSWRPLDALRLWNMTYAKYRRPTARYGFKGARVH